MTKHSELLWIADDLRLRYPRSSKRMDARLARGFIALSAELQKERKQRVEFTMQALRNSGIDVECGACMEIAFTGVTTNEHTCAGAERVRVCRCGEYETCSECRS